MPIEMVLPISSLTRPLCLPWIGSVACDFETKTQFKKADSQGPRTRGMRISASNLIHRRDKITRALRHIAQRNLCGMNRDDVFIGPGKSP